MISRMALFPLALAISFSVTACKPRQSSETTPPPSNGVMNATLAAAGVATGGVCGGIAGAQCSSDKDFCKKPAGQCKTADAQGKCTTRPQICTEQYQPVCGCDGKTYGNSCAADAAGVSVDKPGECPKA